MKIYNWLQANAVSIVLVMSYVTTMLDNISRRTGYKWAAVAYEIVSSLPSIDVTRLASAGAKKPPVAN